MQDKMKKNQTLGFLILLLVLNTSLFSLEKTLHLRLSRLLEIGKDNLMFASIASICEDDDSNFYVLDKKEHKVFKFSPEGKLILTFGRKGQGPGDFMQPNRISYSEKGQLVIANELYDVSFLKRDGTFIRRVHLDGRLALGYIGEGLFYSWIWMPEDKRQVIVDDDNTILKTFFKVARDSFSVTAPDSSGRLVMFNYAPDVYAPTLLFAHSKSHSAVAVSNRYEIYILNNKGEITTTVQRNIQPDDIKKEEKKYFVKDINEIEKKRNWPRSVISKIIKKIPKKKNYFDWVLLSEKYVFVFRIRKDISNELVSIPVDIFSIDGQYLGTASIDKKPLFISEKYMYFVQSDDQGNLYLQKMSYQIKRKA